MSMELEETRRVLLQVLYDNYDNGKYYPSDNLSDALEIDKKAVQASLDKLTASDLLMKTAEGYRLSEKGYNVAYQRATSFCPHL